MEKGYINSFQSLGTVDGPGIRFVVFLQGCNLRCSCCHNPETWQIGVGELYSVNEVFDKIVKYKEYYAGKGGVTASGGEPLLQAKFVKELFKKCKENGINTCLDTSGSILNQDVLELLDYTDRVLLDVKYVSNDLYQKHVGCSIEKVRGFLTALNDKKIKTTIRQVIIPSINADEKSIFSLKDILKPFSCVDGVELLPFKKICQVKYDSLGIKFPFESISEPNASLMENLNKILVE